MNSLINAVYAETLKLKRTLALNLAIIAPLVIVFMQVAIFFDQGLAGVPEGESPWINYSQMVIVFWGLLMLPLFITLEVALAGQLEHADRHWKHLYALPLPRGAIYAAKQFSGLALIAVSCAALPLWLVSGGLLLRIFKPGLGFEAAIPWLRIITFAVLIYLSSWLVVAIQMWISLRWRSFVVTCAAGIAMTIMGMAVINSSWGSFYPWALPGFVANAFNENIIHWTEVLFGCVGGMVVSVLGGWDVIRREVL